MNSGGALGVLLDTTYLYKVMASNALFSPAERRYLDGTRHRSGARKSPFDPEVVFETLRSLDVVP